MPLPTEKSTPTLGAQTAKVLLYGPPKIGKTTLAATIDPEHTLFVATEPGHGALEIFKVDVRNWSDFRTIGPELHGEDHPFKMLVVDTVDELAKMCQDQVMRDLKITHPSDLDFGKGWEALATEFKLRVGALASLGLGVWFISHSKEVEVKQRVGSLTVHQPTIGGAIRKFLVGFCDHVFFAESRQFEDGERRILHTRPSETIEAGSRVSEHLPEYLPLNGPDVVAALQAAERALYPEPAKDKAKPKGRG